MPTSVLQQLLRFGIVGALAAAVHFTAVVIQVSLFALHPLIANVIAFLVAFQVSYLGHRHWTFSHTKDGSNQSVWRFFLVAVSSFFVNEGLFYCFLRFTSLPYWVSLAVVLILVAGMTFLLGKFWAFAHRPH